MMPTASILKLGLHVYAKERDNKLCETQSSWFIYMVGRSGIPAPKAVINTLSQQTDENTSKEVLLKRAPRFVPQIFAE